MRRVVTALAGTVLALSGGTVAAAETGTIRGKVVDASTGMRWQGVTVNLISATSSGSDVIEREAVTDSKGRYLFKALPTGDDRFYALDARYDGGLFAGRPVSLPTGTGVSPVIDTTIKVWSTTSDPSVIRVTRDNVFAAPSEGDVGIIESVTFVNSSERAYIGRGASSGDARGPGATLGFPLPPDGEQESVTIVDSTLDIPQLLPTDYGFATTIAIPPGENRITFSYRVGGVVGSYQMSRSALYPMDGMSFLAVDPLQVDSPRLIRDGEVMLEGKLYSRWSAEQPIAAGDPIPLVVTAEAGLEPWLLAGVALLVVAVIAGSALAVRRRRTPLERHPVEPAIEREASAGEDGGGGRDDLLVAIAQLDLSYQAGELPEARWSEERNDLKRRLAEVNAEPGS